MVDSAETANKATLSNAYDYMFKVDLDGKLFSLGYNKGENPYTVAQQFIWQEEISQEYLDQIAKFIITNADTAPQAPAGHDYSDPFTGGGRYIPGSSAASSAGASDPFTGAGRYVPGGARPASSTEVAVPSSLETWIIVDTMNAGGMSQKLLQLNGELTAAGDAAALTEPETEALEGVFKVLQDKGHWHSSSLSPAQQQCILRLTAWPSQHRWPVPTHTPYLSRLLTYCGFLSSTSTPPAFCSSRPRAAASIL